MKMIGAIVLQTSPAPTFTLASPSELLPAIALKLRTALSSERRSNPSSEHINVPLAITLAQAGRRVVQPRLNTRQRDLHAARLLTFTLITCARRDFLGGSKGEIGRGARIPVLLDAQQRLLLAAEASDLGAPAQFPWERWAVAWPGLY